MSCKLFDWLSHTMWASCDLKTAVRPRSSFGAFAIQTNRTATTTNAAACNARTRRWPDLVRYAKQLQAISNLGKMGKRCLSNSAMANVDWRINDAACPALWE